jgi:uncharacterized protein
MDLEMRNKKYNIPLIEAVYKRDLNKVEALLKSGANVNEEGPNGMTALICAANEGFSEITKLLIDYAADKNISHTQLGNALCAAASKGHVNVIDVLLDSGVDIDQRDSSGLTALMRAIVPFEHIEAVKRLLERGADPNIKDNNGATALRLAKFYFKKDAAELLKSKNAIEW